MSCSHEIVRWQRGSQSKHERNSAYPRIRPMPNHKFAEQFISSDSICRLWWSAYASEGSRGRALEAILQYYRFAESAARCTFRGCREAVGATLVVAPRVRHGRLMGRDHGHHKPSVARDQQRGDHQRRPHRRQLKRRPSHSRLPPPLWGRDGVGGRARRAPQCHISRPPPPTPPPGEDWPKPPTQRETCSRARLKAPPSP
jgi:hypothetical protein